MTCYFYYGKCGNYKVIIEERLERSMGDNAQYIKIGDIKILQYEDTPFSQRKKVCLM